MGASVKGEEESQPAEDDGGDAIGEELRLGDEPGSCQMGE